MTVHFFTFSTAQSGTSRQRAFRIAEGLQARGINTVIHWPPVLLISNTNWPQKFSLIIATIRSLSQIKSGDVIYLQRTIANKYFSVIMVTYILLFRRKVIFDFDDPVYVHSFFKTMVFTKMADVVTVCTHGQATWAQQYNRNVHIFHISVDFPKYQKFTKDYTHEHRPLTIGWVGVGPEHLLNLKLLVPVFKKLLVRTTIPFKFVLIGAVKNKEVYDLFKHIPGLDVEFIDALDWTSPESVPRELQKFDIGVLPHLSDGEWNGNKTSLKNLEYMACGVATICSAFGEMPYVIQDGVNGYLATTEDEWVDRLEKLLSSVSLCEKFGRAGQQTVKEKYSFDVLIPRMIKLINLVSNSTIKS